MSSKRVDIISLKMVKEGSLLYSNRNVRSPQDGAELFREFLGEVDREHFLVMCLNTKNEPTHLNICHIVDLRQVFGHILPKFFLGATSRMDCSTSQVARQSEKSL